MKDQHDIWDELELATGPESLEEEMFYLISAYADGECSPKERRLVEAYLAERPEARDLLAELRAQTALVSSEVYDPPAHLRMAILEATTRRPTLLRRVVFSRPVALAATASAIAAFGLILWPKERPREPLVDVVAFTDSVPAPPQISPATTGGVVEAQAGAPAVVSDAEPSAGRPRPSLRAVSRPVQAPVSVQVVPGAGSRPDPKNGHTAGSGAAMSAPTVRMGPESGPVARAVPEQPDVVALAGASWEAEDTVGDSRQSETKAAETVRDPREELRRRLRAVNQDSDVQEAFRGGR